MTTVVALDYAPLRHRMRSRRTIALAITRTFAHVACFIPIPIAIAIAFSDASIASACEQAMRLVGPDAGTEVQRTGSTTGGQPWGPILAGCLGVLFGAAVALWHIRGRRRHDRD